MTGDKISVNGGLGGRSLIRARAQSQGGLLYDRSSLRDSTSIFLASFWASTL